MVTVLPPVGTVPANEIAPETGAPTCASAGAPMSIPRCCPAAYGSDPNENGRSTGPFTGQLQPREGAGTSRETTAAAQTSRRIPRRPPVVRYANTHHRSRADGCCQFWLQRALVQ